MRLYQLLNLTSTDEDRRFATILQGELTELEWQFHCASLAEKSLRRMSEKFPKVAMDEDVLNPFLDETLLTPSRAEAFLCQDTGIKGWKVRLDEKKHSVVIDYPKQPK